MKFAFSPPSNTSLSSLTMRRLLMSHRSLSGKLHLICFFTYLNLEALWWSTVIRVICFKGSRSTRRSKPIWRRTIFGAFSSILSWGWRGCMTSRSCTEIWSQLTYSWTVMALQNSVTWTSARLRRKDYCTRRRARRITRRLRCGKINPMIANRTFGAWAAFYMNL